MEIEYIVLLPSESSRTRREKTVAFRSDMTVADAIKMLLETFGSQFESSSDQIPWRLFSPDIKDWLEPNQTLDYYEIDPDSRLRVELRNPRGTVLIEMRDGSSSAFIVDRSQPVKSVIHEITKSLRVEAFSHTYGLLRANSESKRWLREDLPLESQGITEATKVLLCKRYIDRSDPIGDPDVLDEQMRFSQGRYEVSAGLYDDEIYWELQVQLSALLILHDCGPQVATLTNSFISERSTSILAPRWRKKLKSDMLSQLSATYQAMSALALDPRDIKRNFIQSLHKLPSYGSHTFEVKSFRTHDGREFAGCFLKIDSNQIVLFTKAKDGTVSNILEYPTLCVVWTQANRQTLAITVSDATGQSAATLNCSDAVGIKETIAGCLNLAQNHAKKQGIKIKTAGKNSARVAAGSNRGLKTSMSSDGSYTPARNVHDKSEFDSIIGTARDFLNAAEQELSDLVALKKQPKKHRRRSDRPKQTGSGAATVFFIQAASHLNAVSKGVPALFAHLRSPDCFVGLDGRRFETTISQWYSSICSVATCLSGSVDSIPGGLQTIASTIKSLVTLAYSFSYLIAAIRSSTDADDGSIKLEITHAERALTAACHACDLALQDLLADDLSAASMLTCLRDIESSSNDLIAETTDLLGSDLSPRKELKLEITKSRTAFSWNKRMLLAVSTVHSAASVELFELVDTALDAFDAAANSLLRASMEFNSDQYEKDPAFIARRASIRWHWSSLSQSLKTFRILFSSSTQPEYQMDPMLPPVLHAVVKSIGDIFASFPTISVRNSSQYVATVAANCSNLIRTLATLVSLEPSPTLILQSARIESDVEKLRAVATPPKSGAPVGNSQEASRLARRNVAIHALDVLEGCLFTVSDTRAAVSDTKERVLSEAKLLVMNMLQLRSTLRMAGAMDGQKEYTDSAAAQRCLEQLDALLHEILPLLEILNSIQHGGAPKIASSDMDVLLTECSQQLHTICDALHLESGRLGLFTNILTSQTRRIQDRITCCRQFMLQALEKLRLESPMLSPVFRPSNTASGGDSSRGSRRSSLRGAASSAEMMKRMSSRRKLLTRPSLNIAMSEFAARAPVLPPVREGHQEDFAVRDTSSAGDLESVNEAALLETLEELICLGEPKRIRTLPALRDQMITIFKATYFITDLSYKDALELCLTTYPYWTSAESIVAVVVAPLFQEDISPAEKQPIAARVSVALSRLLRFHPHIVQEPTCRMVINNVLTSLKLAGGSAADTGAKAMEDTVTDCVEILCAWDLLHADYQSCVPEDHQDRIDLLNVDLQVLANQLTLVEQRFFDAVSLPELIKTAWLKSKTALSLWIEHSNALSRWVASRILQMHDRKDRSKLIGRMIKLAFILQEMGNFSSMIAIYLALAMDCIGKLTKTWSSGSGSLMNQFTRLSEAIRPLHNFAGYREDLRNAQSPGIPYVAVIMKDLVSVEEVLSSSTVSRSENGTSPVASPRGGAAATVARSTQVLNFFHLETISKIIQSQFYRFRKARYQIEIDPAIFPELFQPQAFGLIPEAELNFQAALLEKDSKSSRRESQRSQLPPIPISSVASLDAQSPRTLMDMTSPKSSPLYGLRTRGPQPSMSAPVSPHGDEEIANSSLVSPTREAWRNHTTFCTSVLQAYEGDDATLSAILNELKTRLTSNLAGDRSPTKSARGRKVMNEQDDGYDLLTSIAQFQAVLLSQLQPLSVPWNINSSISGDKQYGISRSRSTMIQSIAVEALLAISRVVAGDKDITVPQAARITTSVKKKTPETPTTASITYHLLFPPAVVDLAKFDQAVFSHFSPATSKRFVTQSGRLHVTTTSDGLLQVIMQLSCAAKSLKPKKNTVSIAADTQPKQVLV